MFYCIIFVCLVPSSVLCPHYFSRVWAVNSFYGTVRAVNSLCGNISAVSDQYNNVWNGTYLEKNHGYGMEIITAVKNTGMETEGINVLTPGNFRCGSRARFCGQLAPSLHCYLLHFFTLKKNGHCKNPLLIFI